ncbi:hypothetical protein PsYK624_122670 [Phanerochaete sordida]|uniref:Uncharacterized protein n=1 Tax=Phanerochaete sordida TaxID=48140 RepID=A0A9P3GKR7_9APHY|nr:hypothetical protein PsYK624_122670 [Phanerochaete sordida]
MVAIFIEQEGFPPSEHRGGAWSSVQALGPLHICSTSADLCTEPVLSDDCPLQVHPRCRQSFPPSL